MRNFGSFLAIMMRFQTTLKNLGLSESWASIVEPLNTILDIVSGMSGEFQEKI